MAQRDSLSGNKEHRQFASLWFLNIHQPRTHIIEKGEYSAMQLQALKRQALGQKQYLERLLVIYETFQNYVETLTPLVRGDQYDVDEVLRNMERFRLKFNEYQKVFCEWHDGDEVINPGVAAFLYHADSFRHNEPEFRMMLLLATAKFQDILEKCGRDLKELHEQIALEEGQSAAEAVTNVPKSALTKLKDADAVVEIASKWLGKIVKFTPWAIELLKNIHH